MEVLMAKAKGISAYLIVRRAEPIMLDEAQLVMIKQAAEELGIAQSGVSRMLDTGTLPSVQLTPEIEVPEGFRAPQRFTTRAALEGVKKAREGDSGQKRAG